MEIRHCRKFWPVAWRLSRSVEVSGTDTDRSATYDFLLVIHVTVGVHRTVSAIKIDDCNILPVRVFNGPGGSPLEFCYGSWDQKLEWCPYRMVRKVWRHVKSFRDSQTDGRTYGFAKTISRCACIGCGRAIITSKLPTQSSVIFVLTYFFSFSFSCSFWNIFLVLVSF